jgi:hypothetical protein
MREFTWERVAQLALERIEVLARRTPVRELTVAGSASFPLEGRRRVAFFHHPRWNTRGWRDVLRTYLCAFGPEDDATLVLWLDPNQGVSLADVEQQMLEVFTEADVSPENGPDLLLVPERLDLRGINRLYAAVDWVVPNGDDLQAQRARQNGAGVLDNLSPEAWRAVLR